MKTTSHLAAVKAVVFASCTLMQISPAIAQGNSGNSNGNSNRIPAIPVGWLTAFPTVVQTGTKPTLTWSITYPSIVNDYIDIIPPATVNPTEELDCEVRVLGNGVTVSGSGINGFNWVPAEATLSFNGGSYTRIFYGTNPNVLPNKVVWSRKKIQKNETLRFGGRYYHNNSWGPTRTSSGGTLNVRTLVHGDLPPSVLPTNNAPRLEDFIRPYLDPTGRVKIGPMDVIVFMELTHSDSQQSDPGYDMQDMVLLVTFTSNRPKNNNGHGNNVDGVDSSNPGNAPFMQYDSDPNIDDEGSGGGAFPSNP